MSFDAQHIRALPNRRAASLRGPLLPAPAGIGIGGEALPENGISGFLVWLRLWLVVASRSETQRYIKSILTEVFPHRKTNEQTGYQRPPSLLPDEARAAIAPQVLCGRRRRRILGRLNGRGLPASRRYDGLQYLNNRQLTGNQFLERACRLSVSGRVGIYGLEYRLRLCQRRHMVRVHNYCAGFNGFKAFIPSGTGVSFGLSKFHLGPD